MPRPDTGDLYIWWLFGESEQLPHITGLCEVPLTCVRVPERTCDLCSLRQGSMQSWTVAASETVSLLQVERTQGYTPQQNFASFLQPVGLYTLVLSHSLCSKLHESKSSLYPSP
ncbi:uncharacterized protein LOC100196900 [Bos taurus]|uniref:Uncharacterized protein n=2 Tax=Bos TaxID=9903 RepID=B6VAE4_BOVIN|nr:uncharacterized protein LOC100196900 [Bos taurus]ACJ07005.1 hypothetical protein [Bos taurus]DAA23101.1 TPA: hypothetical protein LOC100196900 [Bos taurus]